MDPGEDYEGTADGEDRLARGAHRAIERVLLNYALGIDRRDWELLASCFTADVVVNYGNSLGFRQGRDALMERMRSVHIPLGPTLHRITNIVISADREGARSDSYVDAVLMEKSGNTPALQAIGRYEDRLVQVEGNWRIRRRIFIPVWVRQGSVAI